MCLKHWTQCALTSALRYKKNQYLLYSRPGLIAACQQTGRKTAAYLLPILNKLSEGGHPEDSINCIVMAPTRELAQQIDQQMEGFSYFMPVSSVARVRR